MIDWLTQVGEVRALLSLVLTLTMVVAVFTGQLPAKDLELPFATVIGFYFAAASKEGGPPPP